MMGLVGRKCGMTRIFEEDGNSIPVTVIMVEPNKITQIKSIEVDQYYAVQVTTGSCKAKKVTKALAGHFAKANVAAGRGLWEFKLSKEELQQLKLGDEIQVSILKAGQYVDVTGVSKGRGFAGSHKRHHFSLQYATHGNSLSHRVPGSIGQNQTPGRVLKGKKMPGHMGDQKVTVQSLKVVQVDEQRNLLLVKGGIPGAVNGDLIILPAVKEK
ncbi:MAG: 50S ribosomal protein L3 [Gammaproteobacteria bacterium]